MITKCLTCFFWQPQERGNKPFPDCDGMCRRHAPIGPVIKNSADGWQLFPPMNSNQWCGEYKAIRFGGRLKRFNDVQSSSSSESPEANA